MSIEGTGTLVRPRLQAKDRSLERAVTQLRVVDAVSVLGASAGAVVGALPAVSLAPASTLAHLIAGCLAGVLLVRALERLGAYRLQRWSLPQLALSFAAPLALLAGLAVPLAAVMGLQDHFSVDWAAHWLAFVATLGVGGRAAVALAGGGFGQAGQPKHRVVLVPATPGAIEMRDELMAHGEGCLEILGFVDDRDVSRLPEQVKRQELLGSTRELLTMIRGGFVDEVVVALPPTARARAEHIVDKLSMTPAAVSVAPTLLPVPALPTGPGLALFGLPAVRVVEKPIAGAAGLVKRTFDIVASALLLAVLSPLFAAIALLIRLDSPGPVFFTQRRVGRSGDLFKIYKFRTLRHEMTDHDASRQANAHDPRVTRLGRWLRKTSLDELPQLLNVLNGEMSMVGPRPHAPGTVVRGQLFQDAVQRYEARHRVKPGLTGWAQVNGWRGETRDLEALERRLEHDLFYIANWSLTFDATILLRTLAVPFGGKNAH